MAGTLSSAQRAKAAKKAAFFVIGPPYASSVTASSTPRLSGQHVAGLVVGEGCFYAESQPDPKYRLGWRVRPGFCIEMRADEREVLEQVQSELGCGAIYDLDFGRYRGYESKNWQPHAKFRVSSVVHLHTYVVPFFRDNELFGRKRVAFGIFAELVALLHRGAHREPEGLSQARGLAEALRAHNERGRVKRDPTRMA